MSWKSLGWLSVSFFKTLARVWGKIHKLRRTPNRQLGMPSNLLKRFYPANNRMLGSIIGSSTFVCSLCCMYMKQRFIILCILQPLTFLFPDAFCCGKMKTSASLKTVTKTPLPNHTPREHPLYHLEAIRQNTATPVKPVKWRHKGNRDKTTQRSGQTLSARGMCMGAALLWQPLK